MMACVRCQCPNCGRFSITFFIDSHGDKYRACDDRELCGFEELVSSRGEQRGAASQP